MSDRKGSNSPLRISDSFDIKNVDGYIKKHLDINNVKDYIFNYIEQYSCIIYFAIGSYFNPKQSAQWNCENDQHLPTFLRDAHTRFPNKRILIILIDPLFTEKVEDINTNSNCYHNSWKQSDNYSNVYNACYESSNPELDTYQGVTIVIINGGVTWGSHKTYLDEHEHDHCLNYQSYDIEPMLFEICKCVSNHNALLFYHEFTGRNVIFLDKLIFDRLKNEHISEESYRTKICIDITRGGNQSCLFNLSEVKHYPLIAVKNGILSIENHMLLSKEDKKRLIMKFGITDKTNVDKLVYDVIHSNMSSDEIRDIILFHQIIAYDRMVIILIKDIILAFIRQCHTCKIIKNFTDLTQMKQIKMICCDLNIADFPSLDQMMSNSINLNSDEIKCMLNSIAHNLYDAMYIILSSILVKYSNEDEEYVKCIVMSFVDSNKNMTAEQIKHINSNYENFIQNMLLNKNC